MTDIARELLPQSDEEIEEAFNSLHLVGLAIDDLCFGPATEIDDFRRGRKEWAKPGRVVRDDGRVFAVEEAQAMRGQARRTVILIRFGDYCGIYGMDR